MFKRLEAALRTIPAGSLTLAEDLGKLEDSLKTAAAKNLELIGPGKEWSPKLTEGFMRNWPHDASDPVIVFREGRWTLRDVMVRW
ncbi:MAG: hypothetical protein U0176_19275 [Bacteroidia bacterium]